MIISLNISDTVAIKLTKIFNSSDLDIIVNTALENYISQNENKIKELFNEVEYNEDYNYKALRQRLESVD